MKPIIKELVQGIGPFIIFLKQNKKTALLLFAVYCLAFTAIWRANFYYADDIGRSITGYGWTSDFNRFSSSALQFLLLNMNLKLVDLSPYTQIFALLLTTLSSLLLIYLFAKQDKKPSFLTIMSSAFLGLCPYTIACFVYKFDAPCMALALLAAIFPFLFYNSKRSIFFCISFLGLLIMWTSYQAYSGVYVILALSLAFKSFLEKEALKKIIKQTLFCAAPFFLAAIAFKFCLPSSEGYRSTEVFSPAELIPGFFRNLLAVSGIIWSSFNTIWKALVILTITAYFISFPTRKGKWLNNLLLSLPCLILFYIFSIGAFLLLKESFYPPRSFCGISVAFSITGLFIASNLDNSKINSFQTRLLAVPALLLLYQFFIFEIAFGNALASQQQYTAFRLESLANDLSEIYPDKSMQQGKRVQIQGDIGYSGITNHIASQYPIIKELITSETTGLSEHVWGTRQLFYYYDLGFENAFVGGNERFDCEAMKNIKETSYHTIYSDESTSVICISLK